MLRVSAGIAYPILRILKRAVLAEKKLFKVFADVHRLSEYVHHFLPFSAHVFWL